MQAVHPAAFSGDKVIATTYLGGAYCVHFGANSLDCTRATLTVDRPPYLGDPASASNPCAWGSERAKMAWRKQNGRSCKQFHVINWSRLKMPQIATVLWPLIHVPAAAMHQLVSKIKKPR